MAELTLMHQDDGSACSAGLVYNDAGVLRCCGHGRAVWGSGWHCGHIVHYTAGRECITRLHDG